MLLTSTHAVLLPVGADAAGDAAVPEWIQLLPAGVFKGRDGRGPYRVGDLAKLISMSLQAADGRLAIDENHQIDTAMKAGAGAPARGWIVELQARNGEVWARVEWTPTGQALLRERAYRGISPAFLHAKDGTVVQLLRASLTNDPNLQLASLHSRQEPDVDLTKLRAALGLADDADEAAIIAAAEAGRTAASTHAQQLGRIAVAAGAAANAAPDAIITALQSRGAGAEAELRQTIVALQSQVTTLETAGKVSRATQVVDAAIAAGKPIKPLRDHYITRHCADAAAVEAELEKLPSLHAGGIGDRQPGAAGADGLTADERKVIALMGVDAEAFKKARQLEEGKA